MEFFANSELGDRLMKRMKRGDCQKVMHATVADLDGFQAERSKCHDNADRWCEGHSSDKPVRGWIVTKSMGGAVFDRHSVIQREHGGLLDITPLPDRYHTEFLTHDGSQEEFDSLPGQVVALDI